MASNTPPIALLGGFEPLGKLGPERLTELAGFCFTETLPADVDPFRLKGAADQSVYVASGEVELVYEDGTKERVAAGTDAGTRALGKGHLLHSAKTLGPVQLIRIDDDLIDIMVTWSEIAQMGHLDMTAATKEEAEAATSGRVEVAPSEWHTLSGIFSVNTLTAGAFASLPPAHIAELLRRFQPTAVKRGDVVVKEGDEGDFYYVIESGRARVTRVVGGAVMPLADLKSGDAFGEEALLAEAKRNATVTMRTDGNLLRLAKADFDLLLRRPLLTEITPEEAARRVAKGACWLDVRFPSEYQHDKMPGATNVPLGELRHALTVLDKSVEYIAYCQSGRRSAAAAFLLAQRGFRAVVLSGGLWSARAAA